MVGESVFKGFFASLLTYILPHEFVDAAAFVCSFLFITALFVMFADLLPKRVAMSCPEAVAVRCIRPMMFLIMMLKPLVWLLTTMANGIMRLLQIPLHTEDEITNEDVMATVEAGAKAVSYTHLTLPTKLEV